MQKFIPTSALSVKNDPSMESKNSFSRVHSKIGLGDSYWSNSDAYKCLRRYLNSFPVKMAKILFGELWQKWKFSPTSRQVKNSFDSPCFRYFLSIFKMVISTLKNAIFGPLHFSDVSYTSWPDRSEIRKSILGRIFSLIQMPFGTAVDDIKKGLQTKFQVFGLINAFWGIFQKNNKWHFSRKHN